MAQPPACSVGVEQVWLMEDGSLEHRLQFARQIEGRFGDRVHVYPTTRTRIELPEPESPDPGTAIVITVESRDGRWAVEAPSGRTRTGIATQAELEDVIFDMIIEHEGYLARTCEELRALPNIEDLDRPKQAETPKEPIATPETSSSPESPIDEDPNQERPRRPMRTAGGAIVGATSIGLGLIIGGVVTTSSATKRFVDGPSKEVREDARSSGSRGNALILAGSVSAGVAATLGAGLLIAEQIKHRREHQEPRLSLLPLTAPEWIGVAVVGCF